MRAPGLVDVDVVPVAICGKSSMPSSGSRSVQKRVIRRDPLAAELVGLAADLRVPEPAADTVPRFEDDDTPARVDETRRGRKTGDSGTDDGDVGLDQAGIRFLPEPRQRPAAVRTAPSM